jgi:hypothetical protein
MDFLSKEAQQYYNESIGAAQAQARIIPQAVGMENELMPGLQANQAKNFQTQSQNLLGMYGGLQGASLQAQGSYGNALVNQYGQMGVASTDAAVAGMSDWNRDIYNTFGQQAAIDLALGSSLNAQETTAAQQAARAAASARGLTGNQAIGMEVLNSYQLGNQRQQQRQQTALQANQMGMQMQQFGAQAFLNPAMQLSNVYSLPGLIGETQNSFNFMGPQVLQPESQYLANIRATNTQLQMAQQQAAATRSAGKASMWGSIAGGLIALCWVAREAYGKDDPKWLVFREWLLSCAPEWLYDLYVAHGEQFAEFISDKPALKWMVRKTMDFLIMREEKKLNYQIYGC